MSEIAADVHLLLSTVAWADDEKPTSQYFTLTNRDDQHANHEAHVCHLHA